jgi:hypothetical protein
VKAEDAKPIRKQASRLRALHADSQLIIVMAGYLNSDLRPDLAAAAGADPIEFDHRTFTADLGRAVEAARTNIEDWDTTDLSRRIFEKLDGINDQQIRALTYVDRLSSRISELQATIRRLESPPGGLIPTAEVAATEEELPAAVAAVFRTALDEVAQYGRAQTLIQRSMELTREGEALAAQREVHVSLQSEGTYPLVGAVTLLRYLVEAFQRSIAEWFLWRRQNPNDPRGGRPALLSICQTYESIYYDLNSQGLRGYPEPGWSADDDADSWDERHGMREHFDELATRVQAEALRVSD